LHFPAGTFVHIRVPGGGGYGAPQQRPLAAIQDDLDDGYISPTAARDLYEVEINEVPARADGRWVAYRMSHAKSEQPE
jgi:N-methylhydantoinase B